jgi:hypothetical protein
MQEISNNYTGQSGGGRRLRNRVRGCLSGKKGKTAGIAAVVAPVVGYVVNDLRKPDSLIRSLVGKTVQKLIAVRTKEKKAIDITDKVEVVAGRDEIESKS